MDAFAIIYWIGSAIVAAKVGRDTSAGWAVGVMLIALVAFPSVSR